MKRSIDREVTYPHPPERVWRALTDAKALGQWLMPNDFEPTVGHAFQFRTKPGPGFDGIVDCKVLEVSPHERLSYSWRGGPIDTVVTFELTATADGGTKLRFHQTGFRGLRASMVRLILGAGFKRMFKGYLPTVLGQLADGSFDPEATPEFVDCRKKAS